MRNTDELNNQNGRKLNMKILLSFWASIVLVMLKLREPTTISPSSRCSTNITSTCLSYKITKWNKKNIARHIKEWVKSLRIEWNPQSPTSEGKQCNAFLIKKHTFFHNYGPDAIPDEAMFLGKFAQSNEFENTESHTVHGPVWVDLNNGQEWIITQFQNLRRASARLNKNAVLKNGLY